MLTTIKNRTFNEIYPNYNSFYNDYENLGFEKLISEPYVKIVYLSLLGKYAQSHISYQNEGQFKAELFYIIWAFGPTWEKRVEIQKRLRSLSETELLQGSKAIYNRALNPSTHPGTATLEELPMINEQNTTNYKKSKMEAYTILIEQIRTDVSEPFFNKFKHLFKTICHVTEPIYLDEGDC